MGARKVRSRATRLPTITDLVPFVIESKCRAGCVNAGGVIPYLKEVRERDPSGRDPIQTIHPVTLTGYFKRLLKESGGLLLKEATGLFVELARPATDNSGKF